MSHIDRSQSAVADLAGDEAVHTPKTRPGRSDQPASTSGPSVKPASLWEQFLSPANRAAALKRVQRNNGAPGVDGMSAAELGSWLAENFQEVLVSLEKGTYRPQPVRQVVIPKPGGGKRMLGVPTVLDRLIQQALAQVLTPIFEAGFSPSSFGFRPGRSAHQAVEASRKYVEDGYRWVVDVDLENFFDRVNQDALMARVARKVSDKRVLRLVRRFLEAGVMVDGVKQPTAEGTPQGSPLSPLLSNIMLDDLDTELHRRGLHFVRYADDIRVFVRSEKAAKRVLDGVTTFVEKRLKLRVNQEKSSALPAAKATVLGFGFLLYCGQTKVRLAPATITRLKRRLREITRRNWSTPMGYRVFVLNRFIRGWLAYFRIARTQGVLIELDGWLRRRLRQIHWKQWKRSATRVRMLASFGIPFRRAYRWGNSSRGYWRIAGSMVLNHSLTNQYWADIGLLSLHAEWKRSRQTV